MHRLRQQHQLARGVARALGLALEQVDHLARLLAARGRQLRRAGNPAAQALDAGKDRGERIVDLVRNPGREHAERGEPLAMRELALELGALGDVAPHLDDVGELAAGAGDRVQRGFPAPHLAARIPHAADHALGLQRGLEVAGRALVGAEARFRAVQRVMTGLADQLVRGRAKRLDVTAVGRHDPARAVHDQHGVGDRIDQRGQDIPDLVEVHAQGRGRGIQRGFADLEHVGGVRFACQLVLRHRA